MLSIAIEAARARATVGEISEALERVWGDIAHTFYQKRSI